MNEIEKRFFKEETGLDFDPNMDNFYEMEIIEAIANSKVAIELMQQAFDAGLNSNGWDENKGWITHQTFSEFLKSKYGVEESKQKTI